MSNPYNYYTVSNNRYDLLHPDEFQQNFVFYLREDAPFPNQRVSFIVTDVEEEFDTVYDCATALQQRIHDYIYNSDKTKIDALVEYLEKYLYQDAIAALQSRKQRLLEQLEQVEKQILDIEDEMIQYVGPQWTNNL